MATKSKNKTFTAGYFLEIWIDEDIVAENFEQALEKAKKLEVGDLVAFTGTNAVSNDCYCHLVGVGQYDKVNKMNAD